MPSLPSARTASCWWPATAWGAGASYCGYGTWDAGSCSAACRARGRPGVPPRWPPPAVRCARGGHRRLGPGRAPGGPAAAAGFHAEHIWRSIPRAGGSRSTTPIAAAPRVAILELETGRVLADWRSQVGNGAMAWSADGQLLAVGGDGDDPRVYVWNVRRGALASVLQGHTAEIIGAQFAHSGYLLATTSWDGTTRLWDAASGEPLAIAPGEFHGLSAPDDRRLAFVVGGKIGVWDVAAGPECRTLHPGMLGNRSEARDATGVLGGGCQPRRPAGGDLLTGTASASGRPTRAANWPISRRVTARPCCFTPTGKA